MAHAVIYWFWHLVWKDEWSPHVQDGVTVMRRPTRTGWETRAPAEGELEDWRSREAW